MRLFKINLLAVALLVFSVASASAYRADQNSGAFGTVVNPGDLVTIDVVFDTEGAGDVLLLGLGVLFDEGVFTYREDLSSTTTYLFYTNGKSPYLVPSSDCEPACGINLNISNQVQINFQSTDLFAGVPGTGVGQLVSLTFEATGAGAGVFSWQVINGALSTIFQLGDGSQPPITLGGGGTVTVVPEPTTALLVGLGLVGLGVAGRRSRS